MDCTVLWQRKDVIKLSPILLTGYNHLLCAAALSPLLLSLLCIFLLELFKLPYSVLLNKLQKRKWIFSFFLPLHLADVNCAVIVSAVDWWTQFIELLVWNSYFEVGGKWFSLRGKTKKQKQRSNCYCHYFPSIISFQIPLEHLLEPQF